MMMRAANCGDAGAYERLLGEVACVLRTAVSRRLSRLGFGTSEVEDVVQEVLLAIHAKRHTWVESRPLLPWITAITRYKTLDTARRLIRQRRLHVETPVEDWSDWLGQDNPDPDRTLAQAERALTTLSQREQGVVQAVAIDGETIRGAAGRLAISEGAVRVALHRGLRRLATLANARSGSKQRV